jgi:glycosyltransferase involved in cell wall biosynthesis
MPVFNSGEFLPETLDSVFGQTYSNIEIVAVDGGSSDDTVSILERYAGRFPGRVQTIRRELGSGVCERRAEALDSSNGELIAWLDSDDVWLPAKTEEEVRVLEARPEVAVVYSYFDAFESQTGEVIHWPDGHRDLEGDLLNPLFRMGCFVGALTTLFRRDALETRGLRLRTREFAFGDDYYLWLSLALDWKFARIPKVLARYRRHSGNLSDRQGNSELRRVALLREFLGEFPEAKERLGADRRRGFAHHYMGAARLARAQREPLRALRCWIAACQARVQRDPERIAVAGE